MASLPSPDDVSEYIARYRPLCLRHSVAVARELALPFMKVAMAKGLGRDRVLIGPTSGVVDFLRRGTRSVKDRAAPSMWRSPEPATASPSSLTAQPDWGLSSGRPE
jgi:hypothetical protein